MSTKTKSILAATAAAAALVAASTSAQSAEQIPATQSVRNVVLVHGFR